MTFEQHVENAVASLPAELREAMSNVDIVVEEENDEDPDLYGVLAALHRLLLDVARHVQHRHDLAYDEVELELGGSE